MTNGKATSVMSTPPLESGNVFQITWSVEEPPAPRTLAQMVWAGTKDVGAFALCMFIGALACIGFLTVMAVLLGHQLMLLG